jgi:hypothetical protein
LKRHVQILNPLPRAGFRKIRAAFFRKYFGRSNDAPGFAEIWRFLTIGQKQKTLQIQYLQGFRAI